MLTAPNAVAVELAGPDPYGTAGVTLGTMAAVSAIGSAARGFAALPAVAVPRV